MKYLNKEPFSFGWDKDVEKNWNNIFKRKDKNMKLICPNCDGSGVSEKDNNGVCSTCSGSGFIEAEIQGKKDNKTLGRIKSDFGGDK
jgi:hypothetical protein